MCMRECVNESITQMSKERDKKNTNTNEETKVTLHRREEEQRDRWCVYGLVCGPWMKRWLME